MPPCWSRSGSSTSEDLLAGLLLFRLLYYIIPFIIAVAILGGREVLKGVLTTRVPSLPTMTADALVGKDERASARKVSSNPPARASMNQAVIKAAAANRAGRTGRQL